MDINKTINDLNLSKVTVTNIEEIHDTSYSPVYIVDITGGFNGLGNWITYLDQLSHIIKAVDGWIISITFDALDDIWYAKIGTYNI